MVAEGPGVFRDTPPFLILRAHARDGGLDTGMEGRKGWWFWHGLYVWWKGYRYMGGYGRRWMGGVVICEGFFSTRARHVDCLYQMGMATDYYD